MKYLIWIIPVALMVFLMMLAKMFIACLNWLLTALDCTIFRRYIPFYWAVFPVEYLYGKQDNTLKEKVVYRYNLTLWSAYRRVDAPWLLN